MKATHALSSATFAMSGLNNEILPFTSGTEAIKYIFGPDDHGELHKGEALLILLDLNLPDMIGVDILKRVKESPYLKTAPAVAQTTADDAQEIKRCHVTSTSRSQ